MYVLHFRRLSSARRKDDKKEIDARVHKSSRRDPRSHYFDRFYTMTDASTTMLLSTTSRIASVGSNRAAQKTSVGSNGMSTPSIGSPSTESDYSSTADSSESSPEVELVFSNRDFYTFMAIQYYIDYCSDGEALATFTVLNPRSRTDRRIIPLAIGEGTLEFRDEDIAYRIEESSPLATDTKPDTFKTLYLRGASRELLFDFVDEALNAYEDIRSESPRGMFSDRGSAAS